ncbi:MAG: glutamate ligase domain-containing protein, partial [Ferruginibacter sp.]
NIDKDHQEVSVLLELFGQFSRQCQARFIVNKDQPLAAGFSKNDPADFSCNYAPVSLCARAFEQTGFRIQFTINETPFKLNTIGRHNMENALAAVSIAHQLGVSFETCSTALAGYEGIYRRHQLLGEIKGIYLVDDYAHNPVKCAASIAACQPVSKRVVAWFQPHGYGPTKFLKEDFIEAFCEILRPDDELWMSEIFYAGGTAVKDISSKDLTDRIAANGKKAYFEADRNQWVNNIMERLRPGDVLLLMGARDPSLEAFAIQVKTALLSIKQSS